MNLIVTPHTLSFSGMWLVSWYLHCLLFLIIVVSLLNLVLFFSVLSSENVSFYICLRHIGTSEAWQTRCCDRWSEAQHESFWWDCCGRSSQNEREEDRQRNCCCLMWTYTVSGRCPHLRFIVTYFLCVLVGCLFDF